MKRQSLITAGLLLAPLPTLFFDFMRTQDARMVMVAEWILYLSLLLIYVKHTPRSIGQGYGFAAVGIVLACYTATLTVYFD